VAVLLMTVRDFRISAEPIGERIDLETWEAPTEMKEAFPYYVSGLDKKGQLVFVSEYGKWDIRKYLEDGGDTKILDTYAEQMVYRMSETERYLPPKENSTGIGSYGMIVDFERYGSRQLTHIPSLAFATEMARKFVAGSSGSKMEYGNLINMNAAAKVLVTNFLAPILGDTLSKMKTSGTNKEEWVPLLLEKIPKSSLREEYGGYPSFKPIAVYG